MRNLKTYKPQQINCGSGRRSNFMFKIPKIKMPKIKMPDVVGNVKDLSKKVGSSVKSTAKGAKEGVKNLNPFRK